MTTPQFRIDAEGYWVLVRLFLGFAATMLAQFEFLISGFVLGAAIAMVLCVWLDALTGWYFRRHGPKSQSTSTLEIFADTTCFVVAPIEFVVALAASVWPYFFLPVFLLAAIYRLARFHVQGLVKGGYVGLPVTYNGYLFPLAGLAIHFVPKGTDIILIGLLVATSALMISTRFVVPEL
jgi:phosphatidylserine synthase